MKIEVIAKLFVGYRFSDLCVVDIEKKIVSFCTPGLEEKAIKGFDDEVIDINEITPEFISLIMDLDFIENAGRDDGVIGRLVFPLSEVDLVLSRDWSIIEEKKREVIAAANNIDPEIDLTTTLKVAMIEEMKIY